MMDENKYRTLKNVLKGLRKVKAANDFENRLFKRLRDVESEKYRSPSVRRLTGKEKIFSLFGFLRPSMIPAIGLTVVLLIFIVYYINISLIQKKQPANEISQKTESLQESKNVERQNKDSGNLITKTEPPSKEKYGTNEELNVQSQPSTSVSSDFHKAPSETSTEKKSEVSDERLSKPKLEEKRSDELKTEGKEIDGLRKEDKKEDSPIMRKTGEIRYKDTDKQDDNEKNVDQKPEGREINPSVNQEQGPLNINPSKADSSRTKGRANKKDKKAKNYNDTIKAPSEKQVQPEDSTRNQQK